MIKSMRTDELMERALEDSMETCRLGDSGEVRTNPAIQCSARDKPSIYLRQEHPGQLAHLVAILVGLLPVLSLMCVKDLLLISAIYLH